ncbi:hypothetical protein CCR75_009826 [Bremia lactucae]|uniref:Uncharacterized protein n=1 Tax=Bremia lactucae TaxID=4779 RepID=A0A976FQV6_BRELC|nr:hypothetical protein CCR75_009826 [Bremia lactucae]
MGVSVQENHLTCHDHRHLRDTKTPGRISKRASIRRLRHPVVIELPEAARRLKQKIIASHRVKLTRFSLSHMRHVTVPPVQIPDLLNDYRAVNTLVSGKKVPLTMRMWMNCKSKMKPLDMIHEHVSYR